MPAGSPPVLVGLRAEHVLVFQHVCICTCMSYTPSPMNDSCNGCRDCAMLFCLIEHNTRHHICKLVKANATSRCKREREITEVWYSYFVQH